MRCLTSLSTQSRVSHARLWYLVPLLAALLAAVALFLAARRWRRPAPAPSPPPPPRPADRARLEEELAAYDADGDR